jgi:exodeoxyribonuclease VII large subunit
LKTPTAVAEFLISGVNAFATKLSELEQQFLELVTDQIAENRERLSDLATELNYRVLRLIQIRKSQLDLAGLQLNNSVGSFLKAKQAEVRDCAGQTQSLTTRFVTKQEHGLEVLKGQLLFVTKGKIYQGGKQVEQWVRILKIKTFEQLRFEKQRLSGDEEKLRLIDPQNIIRRGFSINLRNGKIIKSVDQLEVGDLLETLLSDGTVESNVINKQRYGNEKRD